MGQTAGLIFFSHEHGYSKSTIPRLIFIPVRIVLWFRSSCRFRHDYLKGKQCFLYHRFKLSLRIQSKKKKTRNKHIFWTMPIATATDPKARSAWKHTWSTLSIVTAASVANLRAQYFTRYKSRIPAFTASFTAAPPPWKQTNKNHMLLKKNQKRCLMYH